MKFLLFLIFSFCYIFKQFILVSVFSYLLGFPFGFDAEMDIPNGNATPSSTLPLGKLSVTGNEAHCDSFSVN